MDRVITLVDKLAKSHVLSREEFTQERIMELSTKEL